MPVTTPLVLMVAIAVLLLLQAPPVAPESVNVDVLPVHIADGPDKTPAEVAVTVSYIDTVHPKRV